jgi:hypothetical protein
MKRKEDRTCGVTKQTSVYPSFGLKIPRHFEGNFCVYFGVTNFQRLVERISPHSGATSFFQLPVTVPS